jgi:two-component system, NarL family, nitrate/nitrite response regulator NarL
MNKLVGKTLLIDDSEIDLFIQKRFLEVFQLSSHISTYTSASEALTWLQTVSEDDAPDTIFLDLNMPNIDGFGFLSLFEKVPDSVRKKVRIVVLTSSNNPHDLEKAKSSRNVIQYITKPLKQTDMEKLLEKLAQS